MTQDTELRKVLVMNLNERGKRNLAALQRNPGAALDAFTAPPEWKMGLHKNLIARRRDYSRPSEAAADDTFLEDLYSVLEAWFGKRSWLIIGYGEDFKREVKKVGTYLDEFSDLCLRIETLQDRCGCPKHATCHTKSLRERSGCLLDYVPMKLWAIIDDFKITNKNSRIVSGTKAIHHLIPDLLPPMDNKFTGRFFLNDSSSSISQIGGQEFKNLYQAFICLSQTFRRDDQLMQKVHKGFNTSLPKTMDNAIIGYMSERTCTTKATPATC